RPPLTGSSADSFRNGPHRAPRAVGAVSRHVSVQRGARHTSLSPRDGTVPRIRTRMPCRSARVPTRIAEVVVVLDALPPRRPPGMPPMSTLARSASRRLGELLIERTGLSPEHVAHALSSRSDPRERLGRALVRMGHLDEHDLVQALAQQFALPVADTGKLTSANRDAVQLVPEQLARQAQVLALAKHGDTLEVAAGDPPDGLSLDPSR